MNQLLQTTPTWTLEDRKQPELLREQFPYEEVPKILFDHKTLPLNPAEDFWITDTTFRDGQQARPPYAVKQIVDLYTLMHRLGGPNGVIRQSEFFVYSDRDRKAVDGCLELGYDFPEITSWIRANAKDFEIVKQIGLRETGILTSVSDYHIFLKLHKNRRKVLDEYLGIVKAALAEGIVPRCHFEDVTRADIYGFCLPFAEELLKLSQESGIPIKVRLCDTMGYGITYPGAVLPRSVPKLVHAFHAELGYPSHLLEWHGHNDFHKVHINGTTAWLHGCSALNASLLGFGERTGNPPLEGAIMEYIGLRGETNGIDTTVITEIADYFRDVVHADVPSNYPFVGIDFNTTRAGIHADGILKNPEIYNIFDTGALLNRPLKVTVTDKSGMAGIAQWLNEYAGREMGPNAEPVGKRHPGVRRIHNWVMEQYAHGRTTGISPEEMVAQAKRHLPSLFESDFQKAKAAAIHHARILADWISANPEVMSMEPKRMERALTEFVKSEPTIQLLAVTGLDGKRISQVHTQHGEKARFRNLLNKDFAEREWFSAVIDGGETYCSDLFFSDFTGAPTITVAHPIVNQQDELCAVADVDFKFDELVKLANALPEDVLEYRAEAEE